MLWKEKYLFGYSFAAFVGAVLLLALVTWFLWTKSIGIEEARTADLAKTLGQRAEQVIVNSRDMLDRFNQSPSVACSASHIMEMQKAAIAKPYIRAIGYWKAAKRVCGVSKV